MTDNEIDAQIHAQNNVIDGLSLVISQQRVVMRQALEALERYKKYTRAVMIPDTRFYGDQAITALREALGETK